VSVFDKSHLVGVVAGAAVMAVLVLYFKKKLNAEAMGAGVGAGVAGAASDFAGGVIQGGANAIFGVPYTDAQKCRQAKADGDTWNASFYCSAGDFLSFWSNGSMTPDHGIDYGNGTGNW
jgi:hypothetical protein